MSTMPAVVTGTLQILCAILSIILGAIAISFKCAFSKLGWPIWSGAGVYLMAGLFGLLAQVNSDNTCGVLTYLVLCVIAICMATGQCILLSLATSIEWSWEYCPECLNDISRRETVDALTAAVAFVELITAFVAIGFCWWQICGQELRTREMLIDYPGPDRSGHLTVVTAGGYISGDSISKGSGMKYAVQQPSAYPPNHHQTQLYTTDGRPYRHNEHSF